MNGQAREALPGAREALPNARQSQTHAGTFTLTPANVLSLMASLFNSTLLPFIYHGIFIAAILFIAVQPAISWLFIQGWTLSCCFLL